MPTNAQLQELLEALTHRVKALEEYMKAHEEQNKENMDMLREIRRERTIAKWVALAVLAALISQSVGYLIHFAGR